MKHIYNLIDVEGMPKERIGSKANNLSILKSRDNQLVPESWVIDSSVSLEYIASGGEYPKGFEKEITKAINGIEKKTKDYLNDKASPLLLSVRASLYTHVEGIKHYVLNIGMNDDVVDGLIRKYGRHRFAFMTYCQFIYDYSIVVLGVPKESLDKQKKAVMSSEKIAEYKFLDETHLKELVNLYKLVVFQETGEKFPEDPIDQLTYAIEAIYDSWDSKTAKIYRKAKNIKDTGCAILLQEMVFGNLGIGSGVGVIESRNSIDGVKGLFGEFIHEAQGPEIQRQTKDILDISVTTERFPEAYKRLEEVCAGLEIITKSAVKIDFVIEDGKLWVLEIDCPAMSAKASVSVAADMLRNEILTPEEAINYLDGERLEQVFYPEIDKRSKKKIAFKGLSASVGVVKGILVFDHDRADQYKNQNRILVAESSDRLIDEYILDMFDGFIFLKGGLNSQIANYSKNSGKPCITKCDNIAVDWNRREIQNEHGDSYKEGAEVTLDANNGAVLIGDVFLNDPDIGANLKYIVSNADQISRIKTELKADNIDQILEGQKLNLENVGLFGMDTIIQKGDILPLIQDKILNLGTTKFGNLEEEIIKKMKNEISFVIQNVSDNKLNIQLFGNSLNRLMPNEIEIENMAETINVETENLTSYVDNFKDSNPEFGLTGARLYMKNWRLFELQVRSIVEAAIEARKISFGNAGKITISVNKISREEEAKLIRQKFESIKSEYSEVADFEIRLGLVADNPGCLFKIDEIGGYFDDLYIDMNSLIAAMNGVSLGDNKNFFLTNKAYESTPFIRFEYEAYGEFLASAIQDFKDMKKGQVCIFGDCITNTVSVDFLEQSGIDAVITNNINSLKVKVLLAQARLKEIQY